MNQTVLYKKPTIIAKGQQKSWRNICKEKAIPPTRAHSYSVIWHIPADTKEQYQQLELNEPAQFASAAFLDDVGCLAHCQVDFLSVSLPWAWFLST